MKRKHKTKTLMLFLILDKKIRQYISSNLNLLLSFELKNSKRFYEYRQFFEYLKFGCS